MKGKKVYGIREKVYGLFLTKEGTFIRIPQKNKLLVLNNQREAFKIVIEHSFEKFAVVKLTCK